MTLFLSIDYKDIFGQLGQMLVFSLQILKVRQNLLTGSKAGSGKAMQAGEGNAPPSLLSPGETALQGCAQSWAPQGKKDMNTLQSPEKGHRDVGEVEASDT